jgi:hypothetical protein
MTTVIQSRLRDDLDRVRDLPFFPAIPLVPLALVIGNLVMLGLVFWKVSKLTRTSQS